MGMSVYGAEFDRLAGRWGVIENEHDRVHPDRSDCGGVGSCTMMRVAVELEHWMIESLRDWRTVNL
jgi:hypothetical protein